VWGVFPPRVITGCFFLGFFFPPPPVVSPTFFKMLYGCSPPPPPNLRQNIEYKGLSFKIFRDKDLARLSPTKELACLARSQDFGRA